MSRNFYDTLVEERGEEGAREYMRQLRAKVKNPNTGEGFRNKETLKKALEARKQNDNQKRQRLQEKV